MFENTKEEAHAYRDARIEARANIDESQQNLKRGFDKKRKKAEGYEVGRPGGPNVEFNY